MFTVYLINVFGAGMLAFALALIKCCGVAINVAWLPNVRETFLRKTDPYSDPFLDIET